MITINLIFAVGNAYIAATCKSWSLAWWLNIFASAFNAAAVMYSLLGD